VNPTVLIVDDTEFMRFVLREILSEMGLGIIGEAGNAAEAKRLCDALEPDLIAVDLATPGLDGMDLLRDLRRRRPEARIAVITTLDRRDEARHALAAGADGLIIAPFDPHEVRETLGDLLAGSLHF